MSKYYCFYDEILPWRQPIPGLPFYNVSYKYNVCKFSRLCKIMCVLSDYSERKKYISKFVPSSLRQHHPTCLPVCLSIWLAFLSACLSVLSPYLPFDVVPQYCMFWNHIWCKHQFHHEHDSDWSLAQSMPSFALPVSLLNCVSYFDAMLWLSASQGLPHSVIMVLVDYISIAIGYYKQALWNLLVFGQ